MMIDKIKYKYVPNNLFRQGYSGKVGQLIYLSVSAKSF